MYTYNYYKKIFTFYKKNYNHKKISTPQNYKKKKISCIYKYGPK